MLQFDNHVIMLWIYNFENIDLKLATLIVFVNSTIVTYQFWHVPYHAFNLIINFFGNLLILTIYEKFLCKY